MTRSERRTYGEARYRECSASGSKLRNIDTARSRVLDSNGLRCGTSYQGIAKVEAAHTGGKQIGLGGRRRCSGSGDMNRAELVVHFACANDDASVVRERSVRPERHRNICFAVGRKVYRQSRIGDNELREAA